MASRLLVLLSCTMLAFAIGTLARVFCRISFCRVRHNRDGLLLQRRCPLLYGCLFVGERARREPANCSPSWNVLLLRYLDMRQTFSFESNIQGEIKQLTVRKSYYGNTDCSGNVVLSFIEKYGFKFSRASISRIGPTSTRWLRFQTVCCRSLLSTFSRDLWHHIERCVDSHGWQQLYVSARHFLLEWPRQRKGVLTEVYWIVHSHVVVVYPVPSTVYPTRPSTRVWSVTPFSTDWTRRVWDCSCNNGVDNENHILPGNYHYSYLSSEGTFC